MDDELRRYMLKRNLIDSCSSELLEQLVFRIAAKILPNDEIDDAFRMTEMKGTDAFLSHPAMPPEDRVFSRDFVSHFLQQKHDELARMVYISGGKN